MLLGCSLMVSMASPAACICVQLHDWQPYCLLATLAAPSRAS